MRWLLFAILVALTASASAFNTVVIDAGHGGFDRGGVPGQRIGEKQLTLDVALRLRTILEDRGFRVVMTRSTDTFIPLPVRVSIANAQRSAIFMCIHFNSAPREGARGIETYYYTRPSARLAALIQNHLVRACAPTPNRGVKTRAYYVLRKTNIPAVLAECGFLTNPYEGNLCLQASHRQTIALALASAIQSAR